MKCGLFFLLLLGVSFCGHEQIEETEIHNGQMFSSSVVLVTKEDYQGEIDTKIHLSYIVWSDGPHDGTAQIVVYHSDKKSRLGYLNRHGNIDYCCSTELYMEGVCDRVGAVIRNSEYIKIIDVNFNGRSVLNVDEQFFLPDNGFSGVYHIEFYNCPENGLGDITFEGENSFTNPYGELSAELIPLVSFYLIMTFAYLLLGLVWIGLSVAHSDNLLTVQLFIVASIFIGMFESVLWYYDYHHFNINGHFNGFSMGFGVLMTTLGRSFNRVLILSVSMGFGVVKATLGENQKKIFYLGAAYFIFTFLNRLALSELRYHSAEFYVMLSAVTKPPAFCLDLIIFYWIAVSIISTLSQLKSRGQTEKYDLYNEFFYCLLFAGVTGTLFMLVREYLYFTTPVDTLWNISWIYVAYWEAQHYLIIANIAYLWKPTDKNFRFSPDKFDKSEKNKSKEEGNEIDMGLDSFSKSFLEGSGTEIADKTD